MHTKNLRVTSRSGLSTGEGDAYRCIGTAYGWTEEPQYDEGGMLINKLIPTDEAIANARLWAAADDLLEALETLLSRIELESCTPVDWPSFRAGRAAIAKAIGATA